MRNVVQIGAVMAMIGITPAHSMDFIQENVPAAETVGKGRMSFMMWDLYDAVLYAPEGQFKQNAPFALKLTYLRDLKGSAIADRSVEEMRKLGVDDELKLAAWHQQLANIFPDVSEGTSLTGIYTKQGETIFYLHNEEAGRISDAEFGQHFFRIWLDPQTSAPALRASLLGGRQ